MLEPRITVAAPSHPTRVRGLKHNYTISDNVIVKSHPTRVRGLKQAAKKAIDANEEVAPHTGAWIETHSEPMPCSSAGRTPHGCVD